jgi:hypothetical protein
VNLVYAIDRAGVKQLIRRGSSRGSMGLNRQMKVVDRTIKTFASQIPYLNTSIST